MIDANDVPPIEPNELLARFILPRSHIRSSDQTVKPDAFIPFPHRDLSVTRHRDATDDDIWECGNAVAALTAKTLDGRADVLAATCTHHGLTVVAAPVAGNPNHADVANWPSEKPKRKIVALEIAATAIFRRRSGSAD